MLKWMGSHRWLLLVVAGIAALFIAAACDDDDDDVDVTETPPAGEASPTAPLEATVCESGPGVFQGGNGLESVSASGAGAQEGENLKIGVLVPSTGALSTFGPDYINAAELAAKCVNNAGGVNGAEVEIVTGDTGTAAEQGVSEAQRLVDLEGVVAIMGAASSAVSLAVAESVTIPNEVLQISPASTSPALTAVDDNDFLFRTPVSDAAQGVVLAQQVRNVLGLDSVCDLFVNNAYGEGLSGQFGETFTELGGTVTASVSHEDAAEAVSYAAELNQCVEGNPEALVAISYPTGQAEVYLREALEGGIIENFVFVDGTREADLFEQLGWENFDGMFGTAPGALRTEFGEVFEANFVAEYGTIFDSPFVREAFDAVLSISLAAADAGTNTDAGAIRDSLRVVTDSPGTEFGPSEDDIIAALAAIGAGDDIDYQGASGSVTFDENGDISFGAVEWWRVDAEAQELVVDQVFSVDLETGEVNEIE